MPDPKTLDGTGFGLIVIGDEILFGSRHDHHLEYFRALLAKRGPRDGIFPQNRCSKQLPKLVLGKRVLFVSVYCGFNRFSKFRRFR